MIQPIQGRISSSSCFCFCASSELKNKRRTDNPTRHLVGLTNPRKRQGDRVTVALSP